MSHRIRAGALSVLATLGILSPRAAWPQCTNALPAYDFSYVGYGWGNVTVPYRQRTATRTYGAGRFTVSSMMELAGNQVLRGAGRDLTVLYFPNGLRAFGEPCGNEGVDCYDWKNGVIRAEGTEIGIEDLTIEFPAHAWCHYCGTNNAGYNGISLRACTNCWAKNVSIKNADSGLFVEGGSNDTIDGVYVYSQPGQRSHLHIALSGFAKNHLVTHSRAYGLSFHGFTVNWGGHDNVFASNWGEKVYIEPDHNCNGAGGAVSCSANTLYSNITGTIEGIQTSDRAGRPLPTVLWNVGTAAQCPADAYQAQLASRKATTEVVVDNTSGHFATGGAWTLSAEVAGYFGTSFLHDGNPGVDSGTWAKWIPKLPAAGSYRVEGRWTANANRPDRVRYRIYHQGVVTDVFKNQQADGGRWVLMGTWTFDAGESERNMVTLDAGSDDGYVVADAVRFVKN